MCIILEVILQMGVYDITQQLSDGNWLAIPSDSLTGLQISIIVLKKTLLI